MKLPSRRPYDSPVRRAQADATRERILAALADIVAEGGEERAMVDAIAERSGVQRRTVFRHFPTRAALLQGLWAWTNQRVLAQPLPATADDLCTLPMQAFAGFDRHEGLIRASLHSSTGREMRLGALPARRAAFAAAVNDALADAAPDDRRRVEALAHLLYSAAAWETLKDYAGLDGRAAGETVAWAMRTLLAAVRPKRARRRPGR